MTDQEKYADKIAKLLAKAESTNQAEAEALIAKAQELMMQYAVEQAMIDAARGIETDEIEQRQIYFTGNWRRELADICSNICSVNNVKIVQWTSVEHDDGGRKAVKVYPDGVGGFFSQVSSRKKAIRYELTGFRSDLERVLLLETSLRLQAVSAVTTWWNTEGKQQYDWETYAHKVRIRGEFLEEFAGAVHDKLLTAARAGQTAAVKVEAERTDQTQQQTADSVALVLRSRKDRVQDWYDEKYGKLRNGTRRYKQSISGTARQAGHSAGKRADVGQTRLRGRRGLNR